MKPITMDNLIRKICIECRSCKAKDGGCFPIQSLIRTGEGYEINFIKKRSK